ncbi:HAMP domain-containing histidine kinase [Myxococcota bacterium]|nr:HAMP domain-containing histidine kinase [Myxococcota bacterium]
MDFVREEQLRVGLPYSTIFVGLVAATATLGQYLLDTGDFRPIALGFHLGLALVGAYWLSRPPARASAAACFVSAYLSTMVGTFILMSGQSGGLANLAMVSVGSVLMIPDRKWMLASQAFTGAWFLIALTAPLEMPDRKQALIGVGIVAGAVGAVYLARVRSGRDVVDARRTGDAFARAGTLDFAEARSGRLRGEISAAPEVAPPTAPISRELAHDVNNLIGGILGGAELALRSEDHPEELEFALRQIRERALATRDYIRAASGGGRGEPARARLAEMLERVAALAGGLGSAKIEVVIERAAVVIEMPGEVAELERAVMNLVMNAVDAAREANGPIRLVGRIVRDGDRDGLAIRVEDPGLGIPEDLRARVLEPGFTTKQGDHQGLGLAVVARVVAGHGGRVVLESGTPAGSAVELRLPLPTRVGAPVGSGAADPVEIDVART